MGFIKFLALMLILLFALITWSMCIAASITDEEAEKMYQDYKSRKERGKYANDKEDRNDSEAL